MRVDAVGAQLLHEAHGHSGRSNEPGMSSLRWRRRRGRDIGSYNKGVPRISKQAERPPGKSRHDPDDLGRWGMEDFSRFISVAVEALEDAQSNEYY